MKKYKLTEDILRQLVKETINDYLNETDEQVVDWWQLSNCVEEMGWSIIDSQDVVNRTTNEPAVRVMLTKNNKGVDDQEFEQKITQLVGEGNVIFGKAQYRNAPEIQHKTMILMGEW